MSFNVALFSNIPEFVDWSFIDYFHLKVPSMIMVMVLAQISLEYS